MTKKNLLKLLNAIADKKDVEFFDSDKWILLEKGWEGMSELLFYIDEVCGTIPLTHQQNAEKVSELFTL